MEPFDLYSPEIDVDPFPRYAVLREQFPCYWCESGQLWILSRYHDIANAAQDWETFSSSEGNLIDELPGRAGATLGSTDPPRHDRLRALSQAAFLKRNLDHMVEPALELADRALDRILERGEFDFVTDFSSQITVGVLFKAMGISPRDPAEIRRQAVLSISTDKARKGRNEEQIAAFRALGEFLASEVEARRRHPADDLITHLAEAEIDGEKLSDREVVLTTATFVMAGVESLSSFMTMFALNLHDHPDARRRLVADPMLVAPAIEESLRFNTSAQRFKRTIRREIELHGKRLRVGDKVALAYGSGNRDPRKFPDPDVYDIDRRPIGHLGFGAGKHFCLGSQMARMVTELAMRRFLERIPEFHLTTGKLEWISSSNFRSPVALPFAVK
ncbi:MAG: cytochrome P450 [Bradyrhizobiaceae bacterium]|nr:cytochrome P450 [Bradyrhizobiaceae bacterium]